MQQSVRLMIQRQQEEAEKSSKSGQTSTRNSNNAKRRKIDDSGDEKTDQHDIQFDSSQQKQQHQTKLPKDDSKFMSMHQIIQEYFACDDDAAFLERIESQLNDHTCKRLRKRPTSQNRTSDQSQTINHDDDSNAGSNYDDDDSMSVQMDSTQLLNDLKIFVRLQCRDASSLANVSGMDLARVAYGINSDLFPVYHFKQHELWGKYVDSERFDFHDIVKRANEAIQTVRNAKRREQALSMNKQLGHRLQLNKQQQSANKDNDALNSSTFDSDADSDAASDAQSSQITINNQQNKRSSSIATLIIDESTRSSMSSGASSATALISSSTPINSQ
jgi:hypothetical protein